MTGLLTQMAEITVFILFILFALSRLGRYFLTKVADDEEAYFIWMVLIMAIAAVLADVIQLPGIVGAFLAGLAVNATVRDQPANSRRPMKFGLCCEYRLSQFQQYSDPSVGREE